jgi:hypothetical protein
MLYNTILVILHFYITLCYITLCYITLCYITLCYITLCYITLCYITLCYITLCYITLCYVISYTIILYFILECYIIKRALCANGIRANVTEPLLPGCSKWNISLVILEQSRSWTEQRATTVLFCNKKNKNFKLHLNLHENHVSPANPYILQTNTPAYSSVVKKIKFLNTFLGVIFKTLPVRCKLRMGQIS